MNNNHTPQRRRSKGRTALTILILVLVGPSLGLMWWALGLTLAPPWIFLDGAISALLACGGLPLGLVALWTRRLKLWELLVTLGLTGITAILFFVIVGRSGGATGMTSCQPLAAPPPQVRYACVSTSSDNANFRYEFTLEGWANWPVMRIVNSKLSR